MAPVMEYCGDLTPKNTLVHQIVWREPNGDTGFASSEKASAAARIIIHNTWRTDIGLRCWVPHDMLLPLPDPVNYFWGGEYRGKHIKSLLAKNPSGSGRKSLSRLAMSDPDSGALWTALRGSYGNCFDLLSVHLDDVDHFIIAHPSDHSFLMICRPGWKIVPYVSQVSEKSNAEFIYLDDQWKIPVN